MKTWARDAVAVVVLLAAAGLVRAFDATPRSDPDRWFHAAVSRQWVESGMPRALAGPEDLGWATEFPEKEFLFHVFTAAGFALGGLRGVEAVGLALELLAVAALYLLARQRAEPLLAFLLVLALVPASYSCVFRLELLRSLVLAVACFALLLTALLRSSPLGAGLSAAAFALSYHAFYLPLMVLGLALATALWRARGTTAWRAPAAGIVGLGAGVLLNPYFPLQLQASLAVLRTAFAPGIDAGVENQPLSPLAFLLAHGFALSVFVVSALPRRSSPLPPGEGGRRPGAGELLLALVLAGGLTWLLTFRQPRAAEYAVPLTIAVASVALGTTQRRWPKFALGAAATVGLVLALWPTPLSATNRYLAGMPAALERLHLPRGTKTLNTSFEEGTALSWFAPGVHFVDLLDPALLSARDPVRSRLRAELRDGHLLDPAETLHAFHAETVVTGSAALARQLEQDARFVRLEPPVAQPRPLDDGPFAYALTTAAESVHEWTLEIWHPDASGSKPAGLARVSRTNTLDALDLSAEPERAAAAGTCFALHPSSPLPAGWIEVGGSPGWMTFTGSVRHTGRWVQLSPAETDAVVFIGCAAKTQEQVGLRVTLWPEAAMRLRCGLQGQATADCLVR